MIRSIREHLVRRPLRPLLHLAQRQLGLSEDTSPTLLHLDGTTGRPPVRRELFTNAPRIRPGENYFLGLVTRNAAIVPFVGSTHYYWLPERVHYYSYRGVLLRTTPLHVDAVDTPPASGQPHTSGYLWGMALAHGPSGELIIVGSDQRTRSHAHVMVFNRDGRLRWYRHHALESVFFQVGLWGAAFGVNVNTYQLPGVAVSRDHIWLGWHHVSGSFLDQWSLQDGSRIRSIALPDEDVQGPLAIGRLTRYVYIAANALTNDSTLRVFAFDIDTSTLHGPLEIAFASGFEAAWWRSVPLIFRSDPGASAESPYDAVFLATPKFTTGAPDYDYRDVTRQAVLISPGATDYRIVPAESDDGHRPSSVVGAGPDGVYAVAGYLPDFPADFNGKNETPFEDWNRAVLQWATGNKDRWVDVAILPRGEECRTFCGRHPLAPPIV